MKSTLKLKKSSPQNLDIHAQLRMKMIKRNKSFPIMCKLIEQGKTLNEISESGQNYRKSLILEVVYYYYHHLHIHFDRVETPYTMRGSYYNDELTMGIQPWIKINYPEPKELTIDERNALALKFNNHKNSIIFPKYDYEGLSIEEKDIYKKIK